MLWSDPFISPLFKLLALHQGSWEDVRNEALTGAAVGALMGPFGKAANSFIEAIGYGQGMVGTELAQGISKGIQSVLGYLESSFQADIWGDTDEISELMKNPMKQVGIGIAVGLVAGMAQSGIIESGA